MQRERRRLGALGLSAADEQIYEHILENPGLTATDIVRSTDLPVARVRESLATLLHAGLGSRSAGKPARYHPVRPDTAIDALIRRRQEELEHARAAASHLTERFRMGRDAEDASMDFIELIEGRETYVHHFLQMIRGATSEIAGLDKPPYISSAADCADAELDRLERGVATRVVYAQSAIEHSGLDGFRDCIAAGEQARVAEDVPVKMTIVDRECGLIPLSLEEGREQGILLHPSPLLDALISLFETLWTHAVPVVLRRNTVAVDTRDDAVVGDDDLLMLLQAGFKDEAIARRLGVSRSTVERRMRQLMQDLGSSTRFQAGFAVAARLGLAAQDASNAVDADSSNR